MTTEEKARKYDQLYMEIVMQDDNYWLEKEFENNN